MDVECATFTITLKQLTLRRAHVRDESPKTVTAVRGRGGAPRDSKRP
jgi:hypothetical protein